MYVFLSKNPQGPSYSIRIIGRFHKASADQLEVDGEESERHRVFDISGLALAFAVLLFQPLFVRSANMSNALAWTK